MDTLFIVYSQGSNLLVCCKDGSVLEVACPDPGKNDTSKTFLIPLPGLKKKEFKFKSVKDDLIVSVKRVLLLKCSYRYDLTTQNTQQENSGCLQTDIKSTE